TKTGNLVTASEEQRRVEVVEALQILGTEPEAQFDRIARMAAELTGRPIGLVSIVGRDTQYFKARYGLDRSQTDRSVSFCTHTIKSPEVMVVPDARLDERFKNNPLVIGPPHIVYYAGAPVTIGSGERVGTVCIIDHEPRTPEPRELDLLRDLAAITSDALAQRQAMLQLKARESDLSANLRGIRRIFDRVHALIALLDLDGRVLQTNRPPQEAIGIDPTLVEGKLFWDTAWWDWSPKIQTRLEEAVVRAASGNPVRLDIEARSSDGNARTFDLMLTPLHAKSGKTTHIVASGVDITDRLRSQQEQATLASIVEASPDFIAIADLEGRMRFINGAGREMLELPDDEPIEGLRLADHQPDWAVQRTVDTGIPTALNTGAWKGETALTSRNGAEIPVSQVIVPLHDPAGTIVELATIARNVSSTRRYLGALKAREAEFRDVFENAAVGIIRVGVDGGIMRANSMLCDMVGRRAHDLVGSNIRDFVSPKDLETSETQRTRLLSGEIDNFTAQVRLVHADGSEIWVDETASLPSVREDERPYVISIFQDIRDRKQFETQQALLIGELNHRVKNTLATVQSLANQTLRKTPDPSAFVERFNGRLRSLAAAHGLLTNTGWQGASLRHLIDGQVVFDERAALSQRLNLNGPDVMLKPQVAVSLGLVLHELATNAMKYGAWSNGEGRVRLRWSIENSEDVEDLVMRWVEEHGPAVKPPTRKGFGRTLIERSLNQGIHGRVQLKFDPRGVICEIRLPLHTVTSNAATTPA
ncbi:MAG: PAS domain S-box protein, partial [Hyphomicrobiaceae bacterium]